MSKTKFTLRVDPVALEVAKNYAKNHRTTITNLVEEFFRSLEMVGQLPLETPVLDELTGILNPNASIEDYHLYLEKKYLGRSEQ